MNDNGYTFPVVLDMSGVVSRKYLVKAIPSTYLIDANGIIYDYIPGMLDNNEMRKRVVKLLHK